MKLQNEVQFAVNKVNELISRKSLASVKKYMAEVYEAHEWKNFEVRISNDIVKYAAIGIAETSALIERNPGTTDEHITTLCIAVMKKCGLLPFNPDKPADECDEVKKWAAESVAEVYTDGEFNFAVNEAGETLHNKVTGQILQAPADVPTLPGYKANARVKIMAKDFAEAGGKVEKVNRRGVELYEVHRPTGNQILILTPDDFAEVFAPTAKRVQGYTADTLAVLTRDELASLKADTIAEADKLHTLGLFAESVAVSQQSGRLTDEQTRRRESKAPAAIYNITFADGETWGAVVFGVAVEDKLFGNQVLYNYFATIAEAVAHCRESYPRTAFAVYAIRRADVVAEIDGAKVRDVYARRREGRRLVVKEYPYTLTSCTESADFCPLTGCTLTDDGQGHLTPEEIKKIANETRKSDAHKYAEKLSKAADETLNNLFGTTDRVKILTNAHELTEAEARELLAEVKDEKAPTSDEKGDTGTTTPADECEAVTSEEKAPEGESLTPEAVAVVEKIQKSPRRVCLFDTFAELYEVKTKAEADGLHKWQALTAAGVYREGRDSLATIARMITGDDEAEAPAPSCYSQSEKLGESGSQKSPLYSVAEKVGKVAHAAAFFLLSLTIGTSHEAAEIVTNDPAAVLAQIEQAGETVTAYTIE